MNRFASGSFFCSAGKEKNVVPQIQETKNPENRKETKK